MCQSIVNGLDHLHTAIESCRGKPALAHCDLKSKNILVKADLTCCISDLGLALSGDKNGQVTQNPATIRTGTKRYMAPEILAKQINLKSLLQFQMAEMYSLALIFWELLRRTGFELQGEVLENDGKVSHTYFKFISLFGEYFWNKIGQLNIVCQNISKSIKLKMYRNFDISSLCYDVYQHLCYVDEKVFFCYIRHSE